MLTGYYLLPTGGYMADLTGKNIAILVDNYVEEPEFTEPLEALKATGATVHVIASGAEDGEFQTMNHAELSNTYPYDKTLDEAVIDDYDALVLPGGGINADALRMQDKARDWVRKFDGQQKPIAAVCHAPWLLASADIATGRKLTSYFSIQDDLRNAGAEWTDEEVVVDGNLVTSRNPDDLPAFNDAIIELIAA